MLQRAEVRGIGILNLAYQKGKQNKRIQIFYSCVHFVINIISNVQNKKYNDRFHYYDAKISDKSQVSFLEK